MNEEINFCLDLAREQMQESLNHLEISLSKIRAGKASPQMLRAVVVDYYGSVTPLTQMANVTTPDSQTITIQPFDKSMISDIEKAIVNAQLGFNPSNNGEKVIINVPALTEERRRDLVKQVKIEIEKSKISCRNIRQKSNDELKNIGKEGVSEDIIRDAEESVQLITNEYTIKIDDIFSSKESDIMQV
ncbi:ribosome recycling factor [Flavobacteriales bacterium]|jgi:ribosome recycling factor|nr:ribosome recycling factor [Flavobacteriales bacterium]MDA9634630.1 ribosome recycling factor [bacterium]MDC1063107.1 ribosome recycling factor [Flavobacteriales bacterium]